MSKRRGVILALGGAAALFLFAETSFSSSSPTSPSAFDAAFTRRTMRLDLLPHGRAEGRGRGRRPRRPRGRRPVGGQPDASPRRHEPRDVLFRAARPEDEPRPVLARLLLAVRGVGDDGRAEEGVAHVRRVAALPVAEGPRPGRPLPAGHGQRLPADLHGGRRPGRRESRAARGRREGLDGVRERTGDGEARPPHARGGLRREGPPEVPRRREEARRPPLLVRALQVPPVRLQRARARPAVAPRRGCSVPTRRSSAGPRSRFSTGSSARSATSSRTTSAALRDAALGGPLRLPRDPRERRALRRRRHLQRPGDRGRRLLLGRVPLRPRVRPPFRGPRGRVLHVRRRVRDRRREAGAVGAERHRSPGPREASSGRTSSRRGTPLPTPWEKDAFEKESRAIQKTRHAIIAARQAPRRPSTSCSATRRRRRRRSSGPCSGRGKVGAFEGAAYEAKGLYRSSADCIMFTRDSVGFCPVCRRAITRVIEQYARP